MVPARFAFGGGRSRAYTAEQTIRHRTSTRRHLYESVSQSGEFWVREERNSRGGAARALLSATPQPPCRATSERDENTARVDAELTVSSPRSDPYRHPREQQQQHHHHRPDAPYDHPTGYRADEYAHRREPRGYGADEAYGYGGGYRDGRGGDRQAPRGWRGDHDDREPKRGRWHDEVRCWDLRWNDHSTLT